MKTVDARRHPDAAGPRGAARRAIPTKPSRPSRASSTNSRSAISRPQASAELESLPNGPIAPGSNRYKLELGRAERLFGAKRYAQARRRSRRFARRRRATTASWSTCASPSATTSSSARATRATASSRTSRRRRGRAKRCSSMRSPSRELGDTTSTCSTVRRLASAISRLRRWAEEALNNLATYYILQNDDDQADATFRELYEKFPDRPLRGTRGLEDRLVGVQERQLRRHRARVRIGAARFSAVGLSAVVAVLVGARARGAEGDRAGRRALHARRRPIT